MSWPEKSRTALLTHSIARDYPAVLDEWRYTRTARDSGEGQTGELCDLCQHTGLRLRYLIRNQITRKQLWIGGECARHVIGALLLRSKPGVDWKDVDAMLRRDRRQAEIETRFNEAVRFLHAIAERDPTFRPEGLLFYFKARQGFTPSQARLIVWRAGRVGIAVPRSVMRIRLARGRERDQILAMPWWQYKEIRRFLTPKQERACRSLRFSPRAEAS
jgi:hypothetical protein